MVDNPFASKAAARAYAAGRPDYSSIAGPILGRLAGDDRSFDRALDVACGTGISTRMLEPLAREIVGIDVSAAMLALAAPIERARYIRGSAENIPTGDGTVDLITVGSAFHWFERDRFLAEAGRVARPRAVLAVHNHWFEGRMTGRADFAAWLAEVHLPAFPTPDRHRSWRPPEDLDDWKHTGWERYEHTVAMTLDALTWYLLSQSNVLAVLARGEVSEARVRRRVRAGLSPFFDATTAQVEFGGFVACHRI